MTIKDGNESRIVDGVEQAEGSRSSDKFYALPSLASCVHINGARTVKAVLSFASTAV